VIPSWNALLLRTQFAGVYGQLPGDAILPRDCLVPWATSLTVITFPHFPAKRGCYRPNWKIAPAFSFLYPGCSLTFHFRRRFFLPCPPASPSFSELVGFTFPFFDSLSGVLEVPLMAFNKDDLTVPSLFPFQCFSSFTLHHRSVLPPPHLSLCLFSSPFSPQRGWSFLPHSKGCATRLYCLPLLRAPVTLFSPSRFPDLVLC